MRLIPRRVLFADPDQANVRISPDGMLLSYVAAYEGVKNIYVAPIDDPSQVRPVTHVNDSGLWDYRWAETSQHLLYGLDDKGNERWNIFCVDVAAGQTRNLTPNPEARAFIEATSAIHPDEILIRFNDRNPQFPDLHRISIRTGEDRLVLRNPEVIGGRKVVGFTADESFNPRFVHTSTDDGGVANYKPDGEGGWTFFEAISLEDAFNTSVEGFDQTGQIIYQRDSRGRDTSALFEIDDATGLRRLLAEDLQTDVGDILRHPMTKRVQAVSFTYFRRRWQIIDPAIGPDIEYLTAQFDADLIVCSRCRDDRIWIVAYQQPDRPVSYYLYRRDKRQAKLLFSENQELARHALVKSRPVMIRARDGLEMVGYYYIPNDTQRKPDGMPATPLPTILYVHGGPYGRDGYFFHGIHQWLANRGYAVLAVNFRGSSGFGKRFLNASNLQWGGRMHDDLVDAVKWASKFGLADPKRIAIMGGSYGGYAALAGLTFTADTFACAVAMSSISSLTSFLDSMPEYWKAQIAFYKTRIGDHTNPEGRKFLESRSPLNFVDRITKPLLLGHGANDPRCKKAEADQIAAAMQARGLPVVYCLFPDEGHGWTRKENRLSFFAVTESFLSRHLGGTAEPPGEDMNGSSLQIPVGADQIPGFSR
jgi:dipeptidyl aminopeptidase/acylaminoacyl peptidase